MTRYIAYTPQSLGSESQQVSAIQESLPPWASTKYLVCDGKYGSSTESAVKQFQEASGLSPDGVVGPVTGSALGVWRSLEKGFDASHWNEILWDSIPFDIKFCILKATEGVGYEDPKFRDSVARATALSMSIGAYHYTKFKNSPYLEAASFLDAVGSQGVSRLYLDLECRTSGLNAKAISTWVESFLASVKGAKPLCRVGVYTSRNYMAEIGLQQYTDISKYDLWAADWVKQPYVYPWKSWDIWQYSSTGSVHWAEGDIDLNYRIKSI